MAVTNPVASVRSRHARTCICRPELVRRGLGQMYERLPGRAVCLHATGCRVISMLCCGSVCICAAEVLSSATEQSCPTMWVGRSEDQTVCWMAWEARAVDRMPCTCVLITHHSC